ncbi:clustered mitochondria-domain-containing protein [Zopfochytrium polystomum]|nr:clustered mitochondria-domain-containing protein [Zopfochytrium polystomum]
MVIIAAPRPSPDLPGSPAALAAPANGALIDAPSPMDVDPAEAEEPPVGEIPTIAFRVALPRDLGIINLNLPKTSLIQDIRQQIIDSQESFFYTCFHFEFKSLRLSDMADLASIENFETGDVLTMIEDPYTERDIRIHLTRLRELLTNFQSTMPTLGIDLGISYLSTVSDGHDINPSPTLEEKSSGTKGEKRPAAETKKSTLNVFSDYEFNSQPNTSISTLLPDRAPVTTDPCLRSLSVSTWNPPPPQRKLMGDFTYLQATTIEGQSFHITACVAGFYVNRCTEKVFDPNPRTPNPLLSHTLPGLLSQASQAFQTRFASLQAAVLRRHPYEYLLSPLCQYPWATRVPTHTADIGRALDSILAAADTAELLATRDWNDDIQSARELPQDTPQDRVSREQAIFRNNADFVDSAARGVLAIVAKSIAPINPLETQEASQMYVHGGIFFSHGPDMRDGFDRLGGAAAVHVAVGKDVRGVALLNNLDIRKLRTIATAVVDFKGQRMVAQSIVPGILKRPQLDPIALPGEDNLEVERTDDNQSKSKEDEATAGEQPEPVAGDAATSSIDNIVLYGSIDGGKTIVADPEFHALASEVAKRLHLAEHSVVDAAGKRHNLFLSVETKGIVGDDRRRYFLDLARLFPVDIEFLDEVDGKSKQDEKKQDDHPALEPYPHRMVLLRPELVDVFFDDKFSKYVKEKRAALEAEAEAEKNKKSAGSEESEDAANSEINAKVEKAAEVFDLRFNPDAFALEPASSGSGGEDAEDAVLKEQKENVRDLSKFLRTTVIPATVLDLATNPMSVPVDGEKLTLLLHSRGINMRYLGKLTLLLEQINVGASAYAKDLCVQEMIARAAKIVLRDLLREVPLFLASQCIARFLNCLFADPSQAEPSQASSYITPPFQSSLNGAQPSLNAAAVHSTVATRLLEGDSGAGSRFELLTPRWLDAKIRQEISARFRYPSKQLPSPRLVTKRQVPLLRSICLKVGIQLLARSHSWDAGENCFSPADVLNLYPVVKHTEPRSSFGDEIQEHSVLAMRRGDSQLCADLIAEATSVYEQVYGPIHPDTARTYRTLAMFRHEAGDSEACRALQRKAVIVFERTVGVDNPETLQLYMNLAFFECNAGNFAVGLKYMKHALTRLETLSAGSKHPELAAIDSQIAMLLTQGKIDLPLATKFISRAVSLNEEVFGRDHEQTVRSYDHLCQNLMLQGDFRGALDAQRAVYKFLKARAGDQESETLKDAAATLEFLTQKAVDVAKRNTALGDSGSAATNGGSANGANGSPAGRKSTTRGGKTRGSPEGKSTVGKTPAVAAPAAPVAPSLPNKGHLSVEELLKFIGDGASSAAGKKKKGKSGK